MLLIQKLISHGLQQNHFVILMLLRSLKGRHVTSGYWARSQYLTRGRQHCRTGFMNIVAANVSLRMRCGSTQQSETTVDVTVWHGSWDESVWRFGGSLHDRKTKLEQPWNILPASLVHWSAPRAQRSMRFKTWWGKTNMWNCLMTLRYSWSLRN